MRREEKHRLPERAFFLGAATRALLARLHARQTKVLKKKKPTSLEAGFQIQNGARGESRTRTSFDNGF